MKESTYAILGMDRFGRKLTPMLAATGAQIIIADPDNNIINRYAGYATNAVCLDLTNANALNDIGLEHADIAVIDLSGSMEAAIMSVMAASEAGVKKIIATAGTHRFGEILKRIGAHEVVIPQDEAAVRMARRLISEDFLEYYDLGGNLCVIKVHPRKEWVGKSIRKLRLRESHNINVVAMELDGQMSMDFTPEQVIREDTLLALAMKKSEIYDFV